MNRIRNFIYCCVLGLIVTCLPGNAGAAADTPMPPQGAVNGEAAHELIRVLSSKLLVLDVRTLEEFSAGHVPGAMHMPVQELEKRTHELPADRPVLIVCRTGRRAAAAYEILARTWPDKRDMWFLQGTPEYLPDGNYVFR